MPSEAQARIAINKLLEDAGSRFLPDRQGRRENIVCEHRVTKKVFAPNVDLGADFEHAPQGFVDYVLLHTDGRPVAMVEAKKESIDPLSAKEQPRTQAANRGVIPARIKHELDIPRLSASGITAGHGTNLATAAANAVLARSEVEAALFGARA